MTSKKLSAMEFAIWGTFTISLWMLSATVFLPFLFLFKYNKFFRDRWFSFIYMEFLNIFLRPMLLPCRKKAFELLKENLSQRDKSKPLKVLEIGIASGANFEFYPENSHLTALDININFDSYFRENQKKFPNIKYEKTVLSVAENMKDIEDSSMDVVISTYVLCSVTSVDDVVREIKRVLKPGGKYLFLEHVAHPKSDWRFTLQKFANPLWTIYMDGCCLVRNNNRDTIKSAGFSDVICEKTFSQSVTVFIRAQIYGLATK